MAIKIVNIRDLKSQIASTVTNTVLLPSVIEATRVCQPEIGRAFAESFSRTLVGRALSGEFVGDSNLDLPALLGFGDGEAPSTEEVFIEISEVLEQVIEIVDIRGTRGSVAKDFAPVSISFTIQAIDIDAALDSQINGVYASEGGLVPWLEFLLQGGNIPNFDVVFELSQRGIELSRSGRALMYENIGSFDIDASDFSSFGANFVEDIIEDQSWREVARRCIVRELRRNINSG